MAERSIRIDAPPEVIFNYLTDFARHTEWAQHPLKLEQTSSGSVQAGSTFKSVGRQVGRDFEAEVRITEHVPHEKLSFEAEGKDFHFSHYFKLEAEEDGTRLTKGGEPKRVGFPFNLVLPIISALGVVNRGLDGDLKRIKERIEASRVVPASTEETAE